MIADKKREKKENRRTKETKKGSQNMIKACIFDLDGTIADTVESIAHAVNRVLEHFGLVPRPVEAFNFYAGDGFDLAVERALKDAGDAELNYLQEGIRLGVSNEEIRRRMTYWEHHGVYLVPFLECSISPACSRCDLKLHSNASFFASRFLQLYYSKITDLKTLTAYLHSVDK